MGWRLYLLLPAIAACTSVTEPSRLRVALDRIEVEWVTPELRRELVDGRFLGIDPGPEFAEELARAEALDLFAVHLANVGTPGNPIGEYVEEGFGGPIDFASLRLCDRMFYLRSSFERLPNTSGGDVLGSAIGGSWFAQYCLPDGTYAVNALVWAGTDVRAVNGKLVIPGGITSAMLVTPMRPNGPRLPSPEAAVERVYRATSKRIAAVPYLIKDIYDVPPKGPIDDNRPLGVYWRVEIESPVAFVDAAGKVDTASVFYAPYAWQALGLPGVYVATEPALPPFDATLDLFEGPETVRLVPRWEINLVRWRAPGGT